MASNSITPLQKSLATRLRNAMDAEQIRTLAKTIDTLQQGGMEVDDVFPVGIVINPDGVAVRGHLPIGLVPKLGELIPTMPGVKEVRIFPRGIVAPDRYRVHLTFGR